MPVCVCVCLGEGGVWHSEGWGWGGCRVGSAHAQQHSQRVFDHPATVGWDELSTMLINGDGHSWPRVLRTYSACRLPPKHTHTPIPWLSACLLPACVACLCNLHANTCLLHPTAATLHRCAVTRTWPACAPAPSLRSLLTATTSRSSTGTPSTTPLAPLASCSRRTSDFLAFFWVGFSECVARIVACCEKLEGAVDAGTGR